MLSEEGEKNWKLRNFNLPNVFVLQFVTFDSLKRFLLKK